MLQLTDAYTELISNFDNSDPNWVQFLRDHFSIIKAEYTGKFFIDEITMNTYQYRMEDFLENNKIPQSFMWFILEINQMNSPMQFHDLDYLIMPSYDYLAKLHELFNSTEANKESER